MQRLLALLLVLLGLIGLVLGRLGDTVWAPATETTATVQLSDPGPAVVIDPGVLYIGGTEGEVEITGASDVSVITAPNGDIDAYLEGTHYTRITGASDWTTLSTEEVEPEGEDELSNPTDSDLWRTVETSPSPVTIDVADFAAAEQGDNAQPARAILLVTDGTEAGAQSVSITWPVDDENEWVPFSYAGGAALAIIGLLLGLVSLTGVGRRGREDDAEEIEDEEELAEDGSPEAVEDGARDEEGTAPVDRDDAAAADAAGEDDTADTVVLAPVEPDLAARADEQGLVDDREPAGAEEDALGAPRDEDDTDVLAPVTDEDPAPSAPTAGETTDVLPPTVADGQDQTDVLPPVQDEEPTAQDPEEQR